MGVGVGVRNANEACAICKLKLGREGGREGGRGIGQIPRIIRIFVGIAHFFA